jgi:hypothetical protein
MKKAGVGGAAVPGRPWLAGTEARPTGLFSYKRCVRRTLRKTFRNSNRGGLGSGEIMKNWQVEVLGLLLPGSVGFKAHPQGRQERDKNEKKPGTQRPPCQEGDNSGFPRLHQSHGTFFNLPLRKSPNTCPERSVAFFTASAAEQASIAAPGNQRPASP